VILAVDGTLVGSNDAHAHAWVAAFASAGITVACDRVRRPIGAGCQDAGPAHHLTARDREGLRRIIETPVAP
jgi:beta-phosphoglucomutase-like phosphatase (HAD superfamily)